MSFSLHQTDSRNFTMDPGYFPPPHTQLMQQSSEKGHMYWEKKNKNRKKAKKTKKKEVTIFFKEVKRACCRAQRKSTLSRTYKLNLREHAIINIIGQTQVRLRQIDNLTLHLTYLLKVPTYLWFSCTWFSTISLFFFFFFF